MDEKWTVRNVSTDARDMIEEVNLLTGIPMGRLVSMAIEEWYSELDEDNPMPPYRRSED